MKVYIFKILCYVGKKIGGWSAVCWELWGEEEVVGEIVGCFGKGMLKVDENMPAERIIGKMIRADKDVMNHYLELLYLVRKYMSEEETATVFQIVDELIVDEMFKEKCAVLLYGLCTNKPKNCQLALRMKNLGIVFKDSPNSV